MESELGDVEFPRELAEDLIRAVALSYVAAGQIDPQGKTAEQIMREGAARAREDYRDPDFRPTFIIDHHDEILSNARSLGDADRHQFAVVFYAMWIEHWLNWMLAWKAQRLELTSEETIQLLKMNVDQKLGAAWTITFGSSFDRELRNRIKSITDARNGFVHYKWPSFDPDDESKEQSDEQFRSHARTAEDVVARLRELRDDIAFGGAEKVLGDRD
jgi:hypothetical protein